MYDPNDSSRAQRRYYREMRRYYRYQNPMRGLAGGIFILFLIFAFLIHGNFLVLLFVGLAFFAFFGSLSTLNHHSIYGGIHGAVWMLGLALCFAIGFWPWILLPVAVTMILGALFRPIVMGMAGSGFLATAPPPQPQPSQYVPPQEQPPQEQPPMEQS